MDHFFFLVSPQLNVAMFGEEPAQDVDDTRSPADASKVMDRFRVAAEFHLSFTTRAEFYPPFCIAKQRFHAS